MQATNILPYAIGAGVALIVVALIRLPRLFRQQRTEKRLQRLHPAMMTFVSASLREQLAVLLNRRSALLSDDLWLIGWTDADMTDYYLQISVVMVLLLLCVAAVITLIAHLTLFTLLPFVVVGIGAALIGARYIAIGNIQSKATKARALMQSSLPNVITLMRLAVRAGRSPLSALSELYSTLAPVMDVTGRRDLETLLQEANTTSLGEAFILFGAKYKVQDMRTLGQYLLENAQRGTALSDVLATFLSISHQRSHAAYLDEIKKRSTVASLLPIPAVFTIVVVVGAVFFAQMGGVTGLLGLFGK